MESRALHIFGHWLASLFSLWAIIKPLNLTSRPALVLLFFFYTPVRGFPYLYSGKVSLVSS